MKCTITGLTAGMSSLKIFQKITQKRVEQSKVLTSVYIYTSGLNSFVFSMLLMKKTPSAVSKVTSATFRANQQGFNEKPLSS